ncbi:MAG TPA: 5-oxoprolinase subunit PxpB [Clostridium sp.]
MLMLKKDFFEINAMGDSALIIKLSDEINDDAHFKIKALCEYFDNNPFEGMIEYVPAFVTLTIFYDPLKVIKGKKSKNPYYEAKEIIRNVLQNMDYKVIDNPRTVEIPVYYGGEFGPDLGYVAQHNNLSIEEVIHLHCSVQNRVYMIGFAPGFPYLAGMSSKIATPRRKTPRLVIPEGSVGIAGSQTGVYPISTPGGWQLIGKTPLKLFTPEDEIPSLLRAGDIIKFKAISREEYYELEEGIQNVH